ncbi:hypothetical protein BCR42DRAFT_355793 [Absidia repens]|uniref:FK506-binding protein n=1 Tax=Absidia repens TaxID=90262 RepID=A0A1X2IAG0_9FUNG|nr:hypothetical protein BCR42DRAFT_355793 [Absidia repens]
MSVQGFFGLKVVPGKNYSTIVEHSFRITMASLAETAKNNNSRAALRIKVDDNEFVLCSLTPGKVDQQLLDLIIAKNEEIAFSVEGQHTIHLTGNYMFDDEEEEEYDDDEELDSDEMDSDEAQLMLEGEDDEDDEDLDNDAILNSVPEGIDRAKVLAYLNGEIDSDDMVSDSEEELDESRIEEIEEDEEEEEEPAKPLTKKEKKAAAAAAAAAKEEKPKEEKPLTKKEKKAAAAAEKEQAAKQEKKRAADAQKEEPAKKQKTEEKKPKQQEKKQVTKLPSGLIIEDVKVGDGANVKSGARIGMRYIGKLTNGKVFDKNTSGKPFNFVLGRGEVIKGWDQGILGMKLGGERKLTIPAPLAYGKRGAPPQIPGNATLVFEIKLVSMK